MKTKKAQRAKADHGSKGDLHKYPVKAGGKPPAKAGEKPKGEAVRRSAKPESVLRKAGHKGESPENSDTLFPHDPPPPPELEASKEWLKAELTARGVVKPVVCRGRKGNGVDVRDGTRKLGHLSNDELAARSADAVEDLFRLHGSLTVEFDPAAAKAVDWVLFGVCRAVPAGQRAVVMSLFRGEHERCKPPERPDSHAYPVFNLAVTDWLFRSKDKRIASLKLDSGLCAMASKQAAAKYEQWRRSCQSDQSPPWFTSISCPVKCEKYELKLRGRELYVKLTLQSEPKDERGRNPVFEVKAYAHGGSGWADLRRVISGEFTRQAARLLWNEARRRWLLKISYTRARPEVQQGVGAMVVCPGIDSVVRIFTDECWPAPKDDTSGLIARKLALDTRKGQLGRHKNHQGKAAHGHGKKRFLRLLKRFSDYERNFDETFCRQQAAWATRIAQGLRQTKHGWTEQRGSVGEVIVADFGSRCPTLPRLSDPVKDAENRRIERILRRFPICLLRDAIVWALTKAGIPHRVVKVTGLCPVCGQARLKQFLGLEWVCPHCHQKAGRDWFTALQTFAAGAPSGHYDLDAVKAAFKRQASFKRIVRINKGDQDEEAGASGSQEAAE